METPTSKPEREGLAASPRLFESKLLDKLSRVHPRTVLMVYVPLIVAVAAYSVAVVGAGAAVAWSILGLLGWTLTEYLGHRFLFHRVLPLPLGLGQRLQYLIHGVHHVHPNDSLRLVMPPLLSGVIMSIAGSVIFLLFGAARMWPILAGFMLGYLAYDCVHYWLHHGEPRSRLGRHLRLRHMHHHFHDDATGFGVMSAWWDDLLGTRFVARGRDTQERTPR